MLPHVIIFQKRLGYSMKKKKKKERKKNKRKRTNVPLKIKRDLAAQVSSQNLQVSKRGI
jgi:aromatic ring-opening dioxygenase LigB subunit